MLKPSIAITRPPTGRAASRPASAPPDDQVVRPVQCLRRFYGFVGKRQTVPPAIVWAVAIVRFLCLAFKNLAKGFIHFFAAQAPLVGNPTEQVIKAGND